MGSSFLPTLKSGECHPDTEAGILLELNEHLLGAGTGLSAFQAVPPPRVSTLTPQQRCSSHPDLTGEETGSGGAWLKVTQEALSQGL